MSIGLSIGLLLLAACRSSGTPEEPAQTGAASPAAGASGIRVLAAESFLADMARNVAGERVKVETLLPAGVDPHEFEPSPADVARVNRSDVLIVNGAGLEGFLYKLLQNAGGQRTVITASEGLAGRGQHEGEQAGAGQAAGPHEEGDPHFWLDPTKALKYVENIRDGLSQADPAGAETYAANAASYMQQLRDLDAWIAGQVAGLPPERRLLVTNHESLGYFADRYGFNVVGSVIPGVSTDAAPSAREMARLIDAIRGLHVPAIFLEVGSNTQLGRQIAVDTGVKVVTDLYTDWLTGPTGPAPSYVTMMKHDTAAIVSALK